MKSADGCLKSKNHERKYITADIVRYRSLCADDPFLNSIAILFVSEQFAFYGYANSHGR